jgi:hypothetical protein
MERSSNSVTRQLCVLALLLGLVGMHGMVSPDSGCHGGSGVPDTATAMTAAMPVGHRAAPHLVTAIHGMGSMCVFVQSAGWPAMALAILAIVGLAANSGATTRWSLGGQPGRSPPLAGVSLLRRVCVSLT